ncbi:MAG: DHA2 family efflux MFS transporter permease subunit [Microbacteriaceae bacterium]|nr:DHA2 family efflux MFS transporter permease subunit [Microbacteriaceae bacterium]
MPTVVRKRLVLAICCLSLFIVSLDATVVNVALPAIRQEFHSTISELQWVIDSYTLVLASLLLLSGTTADRLGRRRTFQLGLVIFTLSSFLCGLAPSVSWLIVFRILQAIGGSMMNPVALSIVTVVFPGRQERANAIGFWGAVAGVSLALGPLVGGTLVDTIGWRAVFWINVPVGIMAIVLTALFVPESRAARIRRFDGVGQLLVGLTLASLVFGVIEGPRLGWSSVVVLGTCALCAAGLTALIVYERRRRDPLLDLRYFGSIPFSSAALTAIVGFGAYGAFLFLNTLYLQEVRGASAFATGLYLLPLAVATIITSPLSGRLVAGRGTRLPLTIAGLGIGASSLLMTTLSASTPVWLLLVIYVLFGIGFGAINAPITNTAVSGMPREQAGSAAAVASTSRQVGVSIGVAIAGSITGIGGASVIGSGFSAATHAVWWVTVGCAAVVVGLGYLSTGRRATASAKRVAILLEEDRAATPAPTVLPVPR